jgi:hypothetical protein
MSSQARDYPHTHPGFENNLFCNIYAKYVKYAKYVYAKYVKHVNIYAKHVIYAKYANMSFWFTTSAAAECGFLQCGSRHVMAFHCIQIGPCFLRQCVTCSCFLRQCVTCKS